MNKTKCWFESNHTTKRVAWMLVLFCLLTSTQSGCQIFNRFRVNQNPVPDAFTNVPTQDELITHLKAQSAKVKQLRSNVRVSMTGMPSLRGTLSVERPKRFRLKAGLMGISEIVDVGSNEEHFWIFSKASVGGATPTMFYSSHAAYQQSSASRAIPIKPEWVVDALGLFDNSVSDRYSKPVKRPDGWLVVDTHRQELSGTNVKRNLIDARTGLIHQQAVYDSGGNIIAYANALKHRYYPEPGISLPQQVVLNVLQPDKKWLKLTLDVDEFTINSLYGDANKLWAMPTPADVPMIDVSQIAIKQAQQPRQE